MGASSGRTTRTTSSRATLSGDSVKGSSLLTLKEQGTSSSGGMDAKIHRHDKILAALFFAKHLSNLCNEHVCFQTRAHSLSSVTCKYLYNKLSSLELIETIWTILKPSDSAKTNRTV